MSSVDVELFNFDEIAKVCHKIARDHGFWDHNVIKTQDDPAPYEYVTNPSILPEKLCLIHSEISEALDAQRDGDKVHEEEELADAIIRILDYAAARNMSMDEAVYKKMKKNMKREYLHGRKF